MDHSVATAEPSLCHNSKWVAVSTDAFEGNQKDHQERAECV